MLERFRIHSALAALTVFTLLAMASAQLLEPAYETGVIDAVIDGQDYSVFTYALEIPEDYGADVTNERQREFMQRLAGTTEHSASFLLRRAMEMGNTVLYPASINVAFSTRSRNEDPSVGSLVLQFMLDPDTLELTDQFDVSISFYPWGASASDYYALTDGTLRIDTVEIIDRRTLAIRGGFSGLLSRQDDYDHVHNPDDTLDVEATFTIEQVVAVDEDSEFEAVE